MAIKLNADEAWTVYCALDDALHARRNGTGSKHNYRKEGECRKRMAARKLAKRPNIALPDARHDLAIRASDPRQDAAILLWLPRVPRAWKLSQKLRLY